MRIDWGRGVPDHWQKVFARALVVCLSYYLNHITHPEIAKQMGVILKVDSTSVVIPRFCPSNTSF